MVKIEFITHQGETILMADFSNSSADEMIDNLKALGEILENQADHSLLVLENMTGVRFDSRVIEAGKQLWSRYKVKLRKIALVGIEGLKNIVRDDVSQTAQLDLPDFPDLETAKDFLVEKEVAFTENMS